MRISTIQKPAPIELSRFDVLLCEQSEAWKIKLLTKLKDLFENQRISKNHIVFSKFENPLYPIQEKGRRISFNIQDKVPAEIQKLLPEVQITKLGKCTSDFFIASNVIIVKKDDSKKLVLDAKPINGQLFKNKYQMPNNDDLFDRMSQIITENKQDTLYFTVLDLKYSFSQKTGCRLARQCNFNIVSVNATGTSRFLTGFYGLADKPTEFQKAKDRTINHAKRTFLFFERYPHCVKRLRIIICKISVKIL